MKTFQLQFPGNKKVDAIIDSFTIHTDQLLEDGGNSSAPSPFDLFLSSIATCAGINALHYCQKNNLPTKGLSLTMNCNKNNTTKLYDAITLQLKLPQNFPDKSKNVILKRMSSCYVTKHLKNPPEIKINIKNN